MIETLKFSSLAIKGFPMQDPHERSLSVYLPPNYDSKRKQPYPVIFVLAGWSSRSAKYLAEDSVFETPLHLRLDRAIATDEMPPAIVVFPDGTSKLGSSQYINSPALGNYMDYISEELVDLIDSKFHTHKSPSFRGIMGHSSGGFGALVHGFLKSDRFQFVCSSAGDSYFELSLLPAITSTLIEVERAGSPEKFLAEVFALPDASMALKSKTKVEALNTLSLAPCYAPNLTRKPFYGDLFFDLKTGGLIDEIWEKYLNWDPIHLIDRHQDSASELKFVHLECGLQDEYGLQFGHRRLAEKLKHLSIPYQLDEYAGGHTGHQWRFANRIKLMLEKMNA